MFSTDNAYLSHENKIMYKRYPISMKHSVLIGLCLLLLLVTGCSKKGNTTTEFTQLPVYQLTGHTVSLDSIFLRYAYRIRVNDSIAVLFDLHTPQYYCHAFTYPDFEYITSFAPLGEGPEEIVSGSEIRFLKNGHFGVLDSNGRKLIVYTNLGRGLTPRPEQIIRMDESLMMPLDFIPLTDSTFLIPNYLGQSRFCIADTCGRLIKRQASIPIADTTLLKTSAPAVAQAWRSFLAMTPDKKTLVTVTQLGDVLDGYATNNLSVTAFHHLGSVGEPMFRVSTEGYGIPTGFMGYLDVQTSDSCIYALYDGTSFADLMKQNPSSLKQGGTALHVFDRTTGQPLYSYMLDRRISCIHIDFKRYILWATDVNKDEQLVRFELPEIQSALNSSFSRTQATLSK